MKQLDIIEQEIAELERSKSESDKQLKRLRKAKALALKQQEEDKKVKGLKEPTPPTEPQCKNPVPPTEPNLTEPKVPETPKNYKLEVEYHNIKKPKKIVEAKPLPNTGSTENSQSQKVGLFMTLSSLISGSALFYFARRKQNK